MFRPCLLHARCHSRHGLRPRLRAWGMAREQQRSTTGSMLQYDAELLLLQTLNESEGAQERVTQRKLALRAGLSPRDDESVVQTSGGTKLDQTDAALAQEYAVRSHHRRRQRNHSAYIGVFPPRRTGCRQALCVDRALRPWNQTNRCWAR